MLFSICDILVKYNLDFLLYCIKLNIILNPQMENFKNTLTILDSLISRLEANTGGLKIEELMKKEDQPKKEEKAKQQKQEKKVK